MKKYEQLDNQPRNQLWNQLGNQLWNQLGNQLQNTLEDFNEDLDLFPLHNQKDRID